VNLKTISGSLAAETACPNRNQKLLFRHSKKARVTARPPTRANQPRLHGTTAYKPKPGRDIGLRCYRFHVVPFLFVATNSRKPKSPDAHKKRRLSFSFPARTHLSMPSILSIAARTCSADGPFQHRYFTAPFLTVPLNQKKF
jgi:hypothetical protein